MSKGGWPLILETSLVIVSLQDIGKKDLDVVNGYIVYILLLVLHKVKGYITEDYITILNRPRRTRCRIKNLGSKENHYVYYFINLISSHYVHKVNIFICFFSNLFHYIFNYLNNISFTSFLITILHLRIRQQVTFW